MIQIYRRIAGRFMLLVAGVFCLVAESTPRSGQAQVVFGNQPFGPVESTDESAINLATLQTDPELESILEKAKRFQADGNFRVATKLMQAVLERSGDALYSDDEWVYFSLVRQVEQQLAALPEEGLAAYRIEADAEARAMIAAGERGDLANALSQVVSRYFVSSVGDEAAVRLGRLYLDRYDFVSARRVFEKALQHPNLSIERNQILSCVALCDLFLNDVESAKQGTQQLLENQPNLRLAQLVADEIEDVESGEVELVSVRRSQGDNWDMPLGSSDRYGVGLAVNDRMLNDNLVATFQYYYEPSVRFLPSTKLLGQFLAGSRSHGVEVVKTQGTIEKKMIAARRKHNWRPTGMLLFGPDQVYLKNATNLLALKKSELPIDSKVRLGGALGESKISWRSLWNNVFAIDAGTTARSQLVTRLRHRMRRSTKNDNPTPSKLYEIRSYGDTIAAQFSIHNDVLYSIEGQPDRGTANSRKTSGVKQDFLYGQTFARVRNNFLVAYDLAQDGKVLWTIPRESSSEEKTIDDPEANAAAEKFLTQGGLMGAPVGYQNIIIAPVNINGAIWIYGFDPSAEGATLWKSHLCDEPATGANAWSAINVSIDGSDVLVASGLGVVFVLDAATGQIRIARRYERDGQPDNVLGSVSWPGTKKTIFNQGWSSDTIIPYGRQMICFRSDASEIESIDRETGKTLWKNDLNFVSRKLDYLLGVFDGVLYAAGPETIVAYDLDKRQHVWGGDDMFEGDVSMGKGMITPQGIFVPAGKQILHFDLMPQEMTTQPKPARKISVDLGGANVGNLFSDGDRFWVHGGNRIYALETSPE